MYIEDSPISIVLEDINGYNSSAYQHGGSIYIKDSSTTRTT